MGNKKLWGSHILKLAIFATGLSGIVAEYVLATLANYFLGNSVFQWTMVISIMMFSMGMGSQLSRKMSENLLEKFVGIEFVLSFFSSFSALIVYVAAGYTQLTPLIIYSLSIIIGLLIGMEIPLVTRLNDEFEDLRENISSIMAVDYFGSLIGGMFFAFIGIQYLGMRYVPFVLGGINFIVALLLLDRFKSYVTRSKLLWGSGAGVAVILILGVIFSSPIIEFSEQARYAEKVVFEKQSRYQKIVITQWKENYWLYIDNNQQLSTLDEWHYHEPLVHPSMKLSGHPKNVLVMGGGDGCAVREILKYPSVEKITLVDLDSAMTNLGKQHPILTKLNKGSMDSEKLSIVNTDGFLFLSETPDFYDVIIVDLPDPKNTDLAKLYSKEFYQLCYKQMTPNGVLISQSGTPQFAFKAFKCIEKSMQAAGFSTVPLHKQVLTLGEWGYVLAAKNGTQEQVIQRLRGLTFDDVETRWLNNDGMLQITSFGKDPVDVSKVKVNTIREPVLHSYYLNGDWSVY